MTHAALREKFRRLLDGAREQQPCRCSKFHGAIIFHCWSRACVSPVVVVRFYESSLRGLRRDLFVCPACGAPLEPMRLLSDVQTASLLRAMDSLPGELFDSDRSGLSEPTS